MNLNIYMHKIIKLKTTKRYIFNCSVIIKYHRQTIEKIEAGIQNFISC